MTTPFTPELIRPDTRARVIFLCDHASNHIPPEYQGLGLDPAVLGLHVAWDIGAAEVTRRLKRIAENDRLDEGVDADAKVEE